MATSLRKLKKVLAFNLKAERTLNNGRMIRREEEIKRLKAKIAGTKIKAPKAKPTKIEEPSAKPKTKRRK